LSTRTYHRVNISDAVYSFIPLRHSQYQDIALTKNSYDSFDLPTRISPLARHVRSGEPVHTFRVRDRDGKDLPCATLEVGCIVLWYNRGHFEGLKVTSVRTKEHIVSFGLGSDVIVFRGVPFQGKGPRPLPAPISMSYMKTSYNDNFVVYPPGSDPTVDGQQSCKGVNVTWDRVVLVPTTEDDNQLVKVVNKGWNEVNDVISLGLEEFNTNQSTDAIDGLCLLANADP
jgi:hypothetical protein